MDEKLQVRLFTGVIASAVGLTLIVLGALFVQHVAQAVAQRPMCAAVVIAIALVGIIALTVLLRTITPDGDYE